MNFFWGGDSSKGDGDSGGLLQSTSTFDLLSLPTSEAGAFYDQLNKEIEGLRQTVDSQLRDMVEASRKDITVLESKLKEIQSTESSSVMTGLFSSSTTGDMKSTLLGADSTVTEPVANLSRRPKSSRPKDCPLSPSEEAKLLGVLRIGTVEECREDDENDETDGAATNSNQFYSQDRILQTRTRPDNIDVSTTIPPYSSSTGPSAMSWKAPSADGLVLVEEDEEDSWKNGPTILKSKQKPTSDAIDKARNERKTPTASFLVHANNPFDSSSSSGPDSSSESELVAGSIGKTGAKGNENLNTIRNQPSLIDAESDDLEESISFGEKLKNGQKAIAGSIFSPHILLTDSVEDIVLKRRQSEDPQSQKQLSGRHDNETINEPSAALEQEVASPINLSWFFPSRKQSKQDVQPKTPVLAPETPPAHRRHVKRPSLDPPIDKKKVPSNPFYATRFRTNIDERMTQSPQTLDKVRSQSLSPATMARSPHSQVEHVSEVARPESAPPIASPISISRAGQSSVSDEEDNVSSTEDPYFVGRSEALRMTNRQTNGSPEKYHYMTNSPSYDEAYDEAYVEEQNLREPSNRDGDVYASSHEGQDSSRQKTRSKPVAVEHRTSSFDGNDLSARSWGDTDKRLDTRIAEQKHKRRSNKARRVEGRSEDEHYSHVDSKSSYDIKHHDHSYEDHAQINGERRGASSRRKTLNSSSMDSSKPYYKKDSRQQRDQQEKVRMTPSSNDDEYNTEISSALVEWTPPKESPAVVQTKNALIVSRQQPSPEKLMRTRTIVVKHGPHAPAEPERVFFQQTPKAGKVKRKKERKKKNHRLSVETNELSSFSTAIVPHVGSEVVVTPKAKQAAHGHHSSTDLIAIQKTIENGQMVILSEVQGKLIKDPYGDEGRYTGIMLDGLPHGEGTMHYSDGRSYAGEWRNGRWHGKGRAKFVNGDVYIGKYERDRRHGKGRYEWADGRIYDGEFVRNHRHGHGSYTWPDGASYIGEFVDGQRHGDGCYRFADGSVYKGEWQHGKYDGIGECIWASGRKYHGEWRAGKAQGYGVEFRSDGTIRHQGEWKKDRPVRKRLDP